MTRAVAYRFAIANIPADTILATAEACGLAGSIIPAQGFGPWGREETAIVETATAKATDVAAFVNGLFNVSREECFYVTFNGSAASLWHRGGEIQPL